LEKTKAENFKSVAEKLIYKILKIFSNQVIFLQKPSGNGVVRGQSPLTERSVLRTQKKRRRPLFFIVVLFYFFLAKKYPNKKQITPNNKFLNPIYWFAMIKPSTMLTVIEIFSNLLICFT
jgi:hypothetical protein